LRDDEEGQRPLNGIEANMESLGDVGGEKCPGILKIGDGQHRDDAGYEDGPARSVGVFSGCRHLSEIYFTLNPQLTAIVSLRLGARCL
jgi:hypothetical protein